MDTVTSRDEVTSEPQQPTPTGGWRGWWERRRERRRLARQDRLSAHMAELRQIRSLVYEARALVAEGWVQHGWFAYRDEHGRQRLVTAQNVTRVNDRPTTGACLVGAISQAGGGLAAIHTQPVQRALDLTWHVLYGGEHEPVRWCPAPPVRMAHVRDLTRWNDAPERTRDDVTELLRSVEKATVAEFERMRV